MPGGAGGFNPGFVQTMAGAVPMTLKQTQRNMNAPIALLSAVERRAEAMASQEGRAAYWERLAARGLPLFVGTIFILTAILLSRSRAGLLATVLGVGVFYFSSYLLPAQ